MSKVTQLVEAVETLEHEIGVVDNCLNRILVDMKEQAVNGDPEEAHIKADELLCEAILVYGGDKNLEIVKQWRKVKKWYA
jgi:hypothetical protein